MATETLMHICHTIVGQHAEGMAARSSLGCVLHCLTLYALLPASLITLFVPRAARLLPIMFALSMPVLLLSRSSL